MSEKDLKKSANNGISNKITEIVHKHEEDIYSNRDVVIIKNNPNQFKRNGHTRQVL